MADIFIIKRGNRRPFLKATLLRLDENGEPELDAIGEPVPVDLTAASTVTFTMRNKDTLTVQVDSEECLIDGDPTLGEVLYEWQVGDTDVAGNFLGEFDVIYGDGTDETVPNGIEGFKIKIVPQLSPTI